MVMLLAGYETTSGAMGMSLLHFAQHPELRAQLFGDTEGLAHTAVNELLRLVSPVQVFGRNAAHDIEMHGERIPAGDVVLLAYGAANHDPSVFEHPERCVLDRHPNRHVAFGHGRHLCLGANLARLELTIMIERFAELFPDSGWIRSIRRRGSRAATSARWRRWTSSPGPCRRPTRDIVVTSVHGLRTTFTVPAARARSSSRDGYANPLAAGAFGYRSHCWWLVVRQRELW